MCSVKSMQNHWFSKPTRVLVLGVVFIAISNDKNLGFEPRRLLNRPWVQTQIRSDEQRLFPKESFWTDAIQQKQQPKYSIQYINQHIQQTLHPNPTYKCIQQTLSNQSVTSVTGVEKYI